MSSLRHRLLGLLLLGAVLVSLTAAGATWYWAQREMSELLDYQLRQQALSLADKAYLLGSVAVVEPDPEQHIVTQLWDRRGNLRYQSHQGVVLARPERYGYASVRGGDRDWRIYATELGPWIVQLAQPLAIRADIATTAALRMLYPTLAVLPLLALTIWWAVGRVLAPLSGLARTVAACEPAALEPLPIAGLPQEVALLAEALNDLVARQRELLARQQEFMADAAHELRTPLTALRLQLQLLERAPDTVSRDASLSELRRGIERSSVLIERLLSVARLDAQAVETQQPVDLAEVLRRAANEVTMLAQARQACVEVVMAGPMQVAGDERSLLALVVNLLENALRHGPEGGRVHAILERTRHAVRLVVMDQGPGIPLAERSRVFERFHRVPGTTTPGSGLGLAIVSRVADLHGATVRIDDAPGGGTLFEVDFPPAEEDRA